MLGYKQVLLSSSLTLLPISILKLITGTVIKSWLDEFVDEEVVTDDVGREEEKLFVTDSIDGKWFLSRFSFGVRVDSEVSKEIDCIAFDTGWVSVSVDYKKTTDRREFIYSIIFIKFIVFIIIKKFIIQIV